MIESREVVVQHSDGLHARPAVRFVRTANRFASRIQVENLTRGAPAVDAKSLLAVLGAGVEQGHSIRLTAEGDDAATAVAALQAIAQGQPDPPPEKDGGQG